MYWTRLFCGSRFEVCWAGFSIGLRWRWRDSPATVSLGGRFGGCGVRVMATIYEYCIKALGYSESAAHRRISAVRIATDIPEVRKKLDQGKLSLTNVALAQTAFRKSNAPLEVKRQVMVELENKSKREAEALLSEITGADLKPKEQVRAISKEEVRLQLTVPKELLEKLDKIKALRAHKNPKQDYISLLTDMSDYILNKIDPAAKKAVARTATATVSMKATPPAVARSPVTCDSCVMLITKTGMSSTSSLRLRSLMQAQAGIFHEAPALERSLQLY